MGCCNDRCASKDRFENSNDSDTNYNQMDTDDISGTSLSGAVLQISLRLETMKTSDSEIDTVLDNPAKLQAFPGFYQRLQAAVAKIDSQEARLFLKLSPKAQKSPTNRNSLTAFIAAVERVGEQCNPPSANWRAVAETLEAKRAEYIGVMDRLMDVEARLRRKAGEARKTESSTDMIPAITELETLLDSLHKQLKSKQLLLRLRIAASGECNNLFVEMDQLSSLAAEIRTALKQ